MSIVEKAIHAARRQAANAQVRRENTAEEQREGPAPKPVPASHQEYSPVAHIQISLDKDALRAAGLLPPIDFAKQLTEQFRRIKRPLVGQAQEAAAGQGAADRHLIMVTSAFPGEGKTFTSANLAISLAHEKDVSVLLIDADIAKPQLSGLFGMQDYRGLFDALSDATIDAESLIADTDIPGLSFLSAGKSRGSSSEQLASIRMIELMASLVARDPRRLIMLDSPPLLLTNESRELATIAGQIVLVVHAGVTPQESVLEAIELLPEGRHIGLILNQIDPSSADVNLYGYGRYGEYGASGGVEK